VVIVVDDEAPATGQVRLDAFEAGLQLDSMRLQVQAEGSQGPLYFGALIVLVSIIPVSTDASALPLHATARGWNWVTQGA
jgi:hypothetical protein